MKIKKAVLLLTILIFAVLISVTNSPRIAGDFNELAYGAVCESAPAFNTIPPGLSIENKSICGRDDEKTVFKSAVSYFLEKHENSPPN